MNIPINENIERPGKANVIHGNKTDNAKPFVINYMGQRFVLAIK